MGLLLSIYIEGSLLIHVVKVSTTPVLLLVHPHRVLVWLIRRVILHRHELSLLLVIVAIVLSTITILSIWFIFIWFIFIWLIFWDVALVLPLPIWTLVLVWVLRLWSIVLISTTVVLSVVVTSSLIIIVGTLVRIWWVLIVLIHLLCLIRSILVLRHLFISVIWVLRCEWLVLIEVLLSWRIKLWREGLIWHKNRSWRFDFFFWLKWLDIAYTLWNERLSIWHEPRTW